MTADPNLLEPERREREVIADLKSRCPLNSDFMHLLSQKIRHVFSYLVFLVLTVTPCFSGTAPERNSEPKIPLVHYCDLLNRPDTYDGKQIRLKAEYDSGFEHSVFADSRCVKAWDAKKLVWVEFADAAVSNTDRAVAARFDQARWRPEADRDGRITDMWRSWRVELMVVGEFRKSKDPSFGFGHKNVYPFMIMVTKIESVGTVKKL
jgi:hypothetical protein